MRNLNIYMCGVGGQGIGVLSEVMIQASLAAGFQVKGVDMLKIVFALFI